MEKLKFYKAEKFKNLDLNKRLKFKYAISNLGRLIRYSEKKKNGAFVKGGLLGGYSVFGYKIVKKNKTIHKHHLFHRLVAETFLKNNNAQKTFVIHLDFNKSNNKVSNLKWVTQEEMTKHHQKNPSVLKARKKRDYYSINGDGYKLDESQVKIIKKLLANPKRKITYNEIAKRYKVTPMTLYRIKSGENWSHVKAD